MNSFFNINDKIIFLYKFAVSIGLIFLTVSCQENYIIGFLSGTSTIKPVLSAAIGTKAASEEADPGRLIASYSLTEDNELFLQVFERDFDDALDRTKGRVMTTGNISEFRMAAYADDEWHDNTMSGGVSGSASNPCPKGLYFGGTDGITVSRSGSEWSMESDQYWLNHVPVSFWCWNGIKPTSIVWNSISESYDKASLNDFYVADAVSSQVDPIFAYNREVRTFDDSGSLEDAYSSNSEYNRTDDQVDIHFYHALAAINFDVSLVGIGHSVDNIKLSNIYPGGDCTISVNSNGAPQFAWTPKGTKKEYSQAFDMDSDFDSAGRQPLTTSPKVFLMVPQILTDATMTVTFNGTPSSAKDIHTGTSGNIEWKAGKYYTYAIKKTTDQLGIDLFDEGGTALTSALDAHYGNAILRFSKAKPESYSVSVSDPYLSGSTNPADASWLKFDKPASATSFNSTWSSPIGIADLISELKSDTKTHFIEDGKYYYIQAFVDENYYSGKTPSTFVNKSPRSVSITLSKTGSTDASVTISQHSIKSPYDLASSNPLGVEMFEEDVVSGNPCASRNRGGTQWRVPSLQEYYYLWYGYNTLNSNSWPALGGDAYSTSDTGSYASYDGVASTWGALSGTGKVRCVRNLGSGAMPDAMYTIDAVDRIVTMQNVGSGSLRTTTKTGEYSAHTVTGSDNMLPARFKVATGNQKWQTGAETEITYDDFAMELSMDASSVPTISRSSDKVASVKGGELRLSPYDEEFYFTAEFVSAMGAKDVVANSVTISKDGTMSFNIDIKWNAGNNAYMRWALQPWYRDKEGVEHKLGNPSYLYLVMKNSGSPGVGNTCSVTGATAVSGTITDLGDSSLKWYFALTTNVAHGVIMKKPVYSEYYTFDDVTGDGCSTYFEETETDILAGTVKHPDKGKWRVPNQRELSIMLMNAASLGITLDSDSHYSSRTTYNSRPYYYYDGEYTTTGGSLVSRDFKIRCVRDL